MKYLVLFGLGVFLYSLIEYVHHRWGGHTKMLGERLFRSHRYHHQEPMEGGVRLLEKYKQRLGLVLIVSLVLWLGFLPFLGIIKSTVLLVGIQVGYLYSEWFHHRMHHRQPSGPLEVWLWRYHYVHHFVDKKSNYGFTSPLWDFVFFTAKRVSTITIPNKHIPEWKNEIPTFSLRPLRKQTDLAEDYE